MSISVTSAKYDDAKTLWDSSTRNFADVLPHCMYWDVVDGLDATRLKQYLDTGYMSMYFPSLGDLTRSVGSQTIVQYALDNPQLPVVMRAGRPLGLIFGETSGHPNYQADGSHIGSGTPFDSEDWAYQTDLRFRDGDTPRSFTLLNSSFDGSWSQETGEDWLLPYFPSTVDDFNAVQTWTWNNSASYGKALYDALVAEGITPIHFLIDWEDTVNVWAAGNDFAPAGGPYPASEGDQQTDYWYERDNRFNQNSLTRYKARVLKDNWADIMEERIRVVEGFLPNASGKISNVYDVQEPDLKFFNYTGINSINAYGRPKGNVQLYPYYNAINHTEEALNTLSWRIAQANMAGIHLFDCWICTAIPNNNPYESGDMYESTAVTGVSTPLADGDQRCDDPDGEGESWEGRYTQFMNIADAIGSAKICMAMGAIKLIHYTVDINTSTAFFCSPSHGRWSFLVAYDEMQPYHNFIKYGKNYLPPVDIARKRWVDGVSEPTPYRPSLMYGKDWSGNTIDPQIAIVCRVWEENMLFVGTSFNQTEGTVDLKAPTGQRVTVAYSPYGSVTVA